MFKEKNLIKSAGIVLWHTTMSLDGFIAGPGDAMEWIFKYSYPQDEIEAVIRSTGALLVGRRSYEVGREKNAPPEAQKPYEGAWYGPQFVLTHDPPEFSDDPSITFLSGDISIVVNRALEAAAGKNVVIIGATVARQCIEVGLIDEIFIHLVPILLGDGVPFYRHQNFIGTELELISLTRSGQIINIHYKIIK